MLLGQLTIIIRTADSRALFPSYCPNTHTHIHTHTHTYIHTHTHTHTSPPILPSLPPIHPPSLNQARVEAGEEEHVELSQREMTSVVVQALGEQQTSLGWV